MWTLFKIDRPVGVSPRQDPAATAGGYTRMDLSEVRLLLSGTLSVTLSGTDPLTISFVDMCTCTECAHDSCIGRKSWV